MTYSQSYSQLTSDTCDVWQSLFIMQNPNWNQNPHDTSFQCNAIPASMKMSMWPSFTWGNCHRVTVMGAFCESSQTPRSPWPPLPSRGPPHRTRVLLGYLPSLPSETLLVSSSSPEPSNIPAEEFSDLLRPATSVWEEITEAVRKRPFGKMAVRKSTNEKEPAPAWRPSVCRRSSARRFTI